MTDQVASRRRPRSGLEVRAAIVTEGRRLFERQGYEATTLRQVAAAADVSTSVLFRHFTSKSRLLIETVSEPFDGFVNGLDSSLAEAEAAGLPPSERFVTELVVRLRERRSLLRALLTALQSADGVELMRELGDRLDPVFTGVDAMATEDIGRSLRLLVGMTCVLVVLDDWFLPLDSTPEEPRMVAVLAAMTSRNGGKSEPVAEQRREASSAEGAMGAAITMSAAAGRQRAPDEVRHALTQAAKGLFIERGFAATGYAEIASAAGTSESGLFRHFGSKTNLLIESALHPFVDAFGAVSLRWARTDPAERKRRQPEFVAELYTTVVEHRQLLRILMGVACDPAHRDVSCAVSEWFQTLFKDLLDKQSGDSDPEHAYEPELRMRAAIAMIVAAGALDDWFLPGGPGSSEQVVSIMSMAISRARAAAARRQP